MDSDFEGLAEYYNLEDSLLIGYLIRDGYVHEVVDSHEPVQGEAQDRWGFCIVGWITMRPCTGSPNHTCEQRETAIGSF